MYHIPFFDVCNSSLVGSSAAGSLVIRGNVKIMVMSQFW